MTKNSKPLDLILISDGATWIRNLEEELFPDAQLILDFYHLCEKVTDFAKDVFDKNENKYLIGSGAIESENKNFLQQRLKQPGMRWNLIYAQYIVTLMSKVKSGLWREDVVKPVLSHYNVKEEDVYMLSPSFAVIKSDDSKFNKIKLLKNEMYYTTIVLARILLNRSGQHPF
jgi:hypothetical protein